MPRKHTYAVEVWLSSDATRRLNYDGQTYPTHSEDENLYLKLADADQPLTAEESRFLARLAAHYYSRLIDETPGPEPSVMADPDAEYETDTYYEVLGGQTGAWDPPVLASTHARRIKYASTKTGTLPAALRNALFDRRHAARESAWAAERRQRSGIHYGV